MRDGNDSGATDQAHGRLDAGQAIRRGGTDDRSVGLGANAAGSEIGGHACTCAGARSAGIAVERIRILRQSAPSAPAAGGVTGANVRPLTQVGLAKDYRSGLPQLRRNEGVLGRLGRIYQSERSGGRHHLVGGCDIVLDEYRDAVQRPAHTFFLALAVEQFSNGEGIRIDLDHAVHGGPLLVHILDTLQVFFRERTSGMFARLHVGLQLVDSHFLELEWRDFGSACVGRVFGSYGAGSGKRRVNGRSCSSNNATLQKSSTSAYPAFQILNRLFQLNSPWADCLPIAASLRVLCVAFAFFAVTIYCCLR